MKAGSNQPHPQKRHKPYYGVPNQAILGGILAAAADRFYDRTWDISSPEHQAEQLAEIRQSFPELTAEEVETEAWRQRIVQYLEAALELHSDCRQDLSVQSDVRRLHSAMERLGRGQASPLLKPAPGFGKRGTALNERLVKEPCAIAATLLNLYMEAHPGTRAPEAARTVADLLNDAGADPSEFGLETEKFSRSQVARFRANLSGASKDDPGRIAADALVQELKRLAFEDAKDFLLNQATFGRLWRKRHEKQAREGAFDGLPVGSVVPVKSLSSTDR